ncbi:MAG: type 1 glutamine amidotransferase domain-containing protein [Promethearchaeati archaeon SRVP18_Atabeyarchaeia-1]
MTAVILTADEFEDMEVFYPYYRLLEEGAQVHVAAPGKGVISGEHGYQLKVEKTFEEVDPKDYDLLILPGGTPKGAPTTVRNSPKARSVAKAFFEADKPVGAICHGPYTLISAGVIKGRHATSFWGDKVPDEIKQAGGIYEDREVVVDGNLVTSRYPGDLPAFMREVMKMVRKAGK